MFGIAAGGAVSTCSVDSTPGIRSALPSPWSPSELNSLDSHHDSNPGQPASQKEIVCFGLRDDLRRSPTLPVSHNPHEKKRSYLLGQITWPRFNSGDGCQLRQLCCLLSAVATSTTLVLLGRKSEIQKPATLVERQSLV